MDSLLYLFVGVVAAGAVLAAICIWSQTRLWAKVCALMATGALFTLGYAGLAELMSKPKPVHLEWALGAVEEAEVVASRAHEGEAIYLWLSFDHVREPRAYEIPWSQNLAQQLQDAMRAAEETQRGVMMRNPFRRHLALEEEERVFYTPPQEGAPPKAPRARPYQFGQQG